MISGCRHCAVIVLSLVCCICRLAVAADKVSFENQIQPLLKQHCWDCHGPEQQEARLRLDRRSGVLRGGDSGEPALVPGDAEASHLMQLVLGREAGKRMPPEPQSALTETETALLRRWINEGAEWSGSIEPAEADRQEITHWSFKPVTRPAVPEVQSDWPAGAVDAWVLQGLQRQGLTPSAAAGRRDQIRRLYLDMLGLLPTPEEVTAYERDERPDAWELLVQEV
ncbi:MAG: c-type cytochrome domain-containing protein, partial [Planctomycetaceae bacterium]